MLYRASPLASPIEACHLLFGFSSDEFRCVPRVFAYLLNVCKYFIWVPQSALGLLACIKSRVRFYLPLFYKRFVSPRRRRYFCRQWGANGAVGFVSNGVFTFAFSTSISCCFYSCMFLIARPARSPLLDVQCVFFFPLLAWSPLLVVLCALLAQYFCAVFLYMALIWASPSYVFIACCLILCTVLIWASPFFVAATAAFIGRTVRAFVAWSYSGR